MNILISGIGGPTPLGLAKSLRLRFDSLKLIGIDANKFAPGHYRKDVFDKTYLVPNATDKNYWNVINKIVSIEQIEYAFIIPETEVLKWSEYQIHNKLPCCSLIPDFEVSSFLFDKLKVSNLLKNHDLAPKTLSIDSGTDLSFLGQDLGYPYWVRLNKTAGALGAFKVNEMSDIINWLKFNPSSKDYIASNFLPGRNYACKLLYIEGNLLMSASAERIEYLLANASPTKISGMCSRGKLINNPDLVSRSISAIELIYNKFKKQPHGMFTIDFKESSSILPLITEINIRHVSFTNAFSIAGANFPALTIDAHFYKTETNYVDYKFEDENYFIRGVDNELFLLKDDELVKNFE